METFLKQVHAHGIREYDMCELKIGEKVGGGGFGSVYKCEINGEMLAVKRLYYEIGDTLFLKDLLCELIISTNLKSHRYTHVYGFSYNREDDEMYIIMEYLENGDLNSYLSKRYVSREQRIKIYRSLLLAVKKLHSENYIHSDLKPENVSYYYDMIRKKKYIKLLDYNLLGRLKEGEESMNGWCSTYGYSAPEQHKSQLCKKSDVYALGVILLELIIDGDIMGVAGNNYQKCRMEIVKNLNRIKVTEPRIYKIVRTCISVNPSKRFNISNLLAASAFI